MRFTISSKSLVLGCFVTALISGVSCLPGSAYSTTPTSLNQAVPASGCSSSQYGGPQSVACQSIISQNQPAAIDANGICQRSISEVSRIFKVVGNQCDLRIQSTVSTVSVKVGPSGLLIFDSQLSSLQPACTISVTSWIVVNTVLFTTTSVRFVLQGGAIMRQSSPTGPLVRLMTCTKNLGSIACEGGGFVINLMINSITLANENNRQNKINFQGINGNNFVFMPSPSFGMPIGSLNVGVQPLGLTGTANLVPTGNLINPALNLATNGVNNVVGGLNLPVPNFPASQVNSMQLPNLSGTANVVANPNQMPLINSINSNTRFPLTSSSTFNTQTLNSPLRINAGLTTFPSTTITSRPITGDRRIIVTRRRIVRGPSTGVTSMSNSRFNGNLGNPSFTGNTINSGSNTMTSIGSGSTSTIDNNSGQIDGNMINTDVNSEGTNLSGINGGGSSSSSSTRTTTSSSSNSGSQGLGQLTNVLTNGSQGLGQITNVLTSSSNGLGNINNVLNSGNLFSSHMNYGAGGNIIGQKIQKIGSIVHGTKAALLPGLFGAM